ncbi:Lrp/AsnC ligand binding domain-containing protein [Pseudomonas synxantha]
MTQFTEALATLPEVMDCYLMAGDCDFSTTCSDRNS